MVRDVRALGRAVPLEFVVFVVAAAGRLLVIFRAGGLRGSFGYDAAVYYGSADALTHGRVPYRDFVLLHPPGLTLFLTPFAWLAQVVSDDTAFTVANLSFAIIGAINAVLVMRIGRQLGFGAKPALIGGLFYATWFGAVGSEYLTKLEPLGNLLLLCALLAAVKAQHRASLRMSATAGGALGLAESVKIWWIVPVLGVIVWHCLATRRTSAGAAMIAGACGSAVLVNLPFFILAPHQMWSSVIKDQLGRGRSPKGSLARIGDLTTLSRLNGYLPPDVLVAAGVAAALIFTAAIVRAWQVRVARPAVVLVVAQLLVVLAAPSWFAYYCDYLAAAAALTVAGAATRVDGSRRRATATITRWTPTVAAASSTLLILVLGTAVVQPFRGSAQLAHAVARIPCVMSDSPMGQIELNALSRSLADGCPNWIDDTGPTYGRDRSATALPRVRNRRWQRDLTGYLRSGQAIIIVRRTGSGIDRQTEAAISRDGIIATAGGHAVYRVRRAP